jgi:hypothetical protein
MKPLLHKYATKDWLLALIHRGSGRSQISLGCVEKHAKNLRNYIFQQESKVGFQVNFHLEISLFRISLIYLFFREYLSKDICLFGK